MSHFKNGIVFKRFVFPEAFGPITVSTFERRTPDGAVKYPLFCGALSFTTKLKAVISPKE